jgi:hypothetical protein
MTDLEWRHFGAEKTVGFYYPSVRHRANICAVEHNISTFDIELTLVLNGSILRVLVHTKTTRAEVMPCIDRGLTVTENAAA